MTTEPPDDMSLDETALRTAPNVLRDSVETGFMPSGLVLEPDAREMRRRERPAQAGLWSSDGSAAPSGPQK